MLIDCPPSLGILTINALAAVDDVFLPLQPHFLALHGLSKLLKTIGLVHERLNERLQLAGVVLVPVRIGHEAGGRSEPATSSNSSARPARAAGPGAPCGCSKRGSAATSAWPRRRASGSRSSSTRPTSPGAEDYRALGGEVLAYYAGRALLEKAAA